MSQNNAKTLKKLQILTKFMKKHPSKVKSTTMDCLDKLLDQILSKFKAQHPNIDELQKPKKVSEQQVKLMHLIDENATVSSTFTGTTTEMRKIEQLFNSGDIEAFREEGTKIRDYLSENEKASGCFKLYSQVLIGKMIKIYLDKKGLEESIKFFGKCKSMLYKYVKVSELLEKFPRLSVIGADFTLLVHNHKFITEFIAKRKYDFSKISLDAKIEVKTKVETEGEQEDICMEEQSHEYEWDYSTSIELQGEHT